MKKGTIELKGMRFRAFHGCLPEEKQKGNEFVVDFSCSVEISAACLTDRLEDTVDYAGIYKIIAGEMALASNLLEHVAGRMEKSVLSAYPQLSDVKISVSKKNPPVGGECEWATISI